MEMVAQVSHGFMWLLREGPFSHEEFVSNDHKNVKNVGDKRRWRQNKTSSHCGEDERKFG